MKVIKVIVLVGLAVIITAFLALFLYLNPFLFRFPVDEVIWVNEEFDRKDFDVIVIGTEPEGVAAAVAAARNGMDTLLLGHTPALGGLMTLGQLNFIDMCFGRDGTLLTRGIFEEFYSAVGGTAFDISEAKNYFLEIVIQEPQLTLRTESHLIAPIMDNDYMIGVKMLEEGLEVEYTGRRFIDATVDGDLAAMAGAPYTYGGEDIGEKDLKMGVTLVFELSGVSWTRLFFYLNTQRLFGMISGNGIVSGATNKVAWGYDEEGFSYIPNDSMMRFRGPNISRQRQGTVLLNALVVYDVDPLDPISYQSAIDRAKDELIYLVPYLRENLIGFKNAKLESTASQLYVRETRHIIGEYILTIDDVLENRDQWDKIAIGSYPADVQASILNSYGTVIGNPDRYAIPFRSLVPLGVENLLIVGRSASFTSQAASSARVIPLGMACGQAAGLAAAQSINENISFRQMSRAHGSIYTLQATLRDQGAFLDDFEVIEPFMSHWAYDGLAILRRIGLMDGGYQNDYQLDIPISKWRFQRLINGVISKAGYDLEYIEVGYPTNSRSIIDATVSAYLYIIGNDDMINQTVSGRSHEENLEILSSELGDSNLAGFYTDSEIIPQTAEVVMLLANLYNRILL